MTAQLDIKFSRERRDRGIAKAETNANRVAKDWSANADRYFRTFLSKHKGEFFCETFRAWCVGILPDPPTARAFGGVILRAASAGLITKVRVDAVSNVRAHRCFASVWRKA